MLLNVEAQIDLEVDTPEFDKSMTLAGWSKTTARLMVEQTAKGRSEEELAGIDDDILRKRVLECETKASDLIKLFQISK